MKPDIENKILIPFMVLIILSISSVGGISYWNGYRLLLDNQKKNMQENLTETIHLIETFNEAVESKQLSLQEAKEKVVGYYEQLGPIGFVIAEKKHIMVDRFEPSNTTLENIFSDIRGDQKKGAVETDRFVFTYVVYEPWKWTVGYGLNKNIFSEELIAVQKYNLLIVIIFLIISMQATILIAYNLSKPIKLLADTCNNIANGNLEEKIFIRRRDEIGVLANAFNNMMNKLQKNTSKLIEIKQFNEDILRNISTGIITTDQSGNIVSINHTAEEMLQQDTCGQDSDQSLEKVLIDQLKETLSLEKSLNHVYVFQYQQNNDMLYIDVTTSLLKTDEGQISGAICNFNNITERKKIEKKIERVNRLTSVGQLAAGLAHEIRNPLAGMKTGMQVLKKRLSTPEEPSNENLFNGVLYEIDRLNHLITDLLDFAKPRLPRYERANVREILNRALYLIKKAASEKQIEINIKDDGKKHEVIVDQGQIEQVFLNIIANALKAVEQEGTLNIYIERISEPKGQFVSVEFEDNGCGIRPEDMETIFDPFYTTYPQGTGLGLSVVHKLVTENNGEIEVESKIEVGTKFKIKFHVDGEA
ncbi:sensor histidine kinase [Geosporobacter ferrireducens]|uniref:sensor histidine kinase n=1 Tax=Geosporobacter ferrireducens TaxID=1424294 RepID=UPI001470F513|nr:ATP-binding protein [Geosporobacter ferrireducens]